MFHTGALTTERRVQRQREKPEEVRPREVAPVVPLAALAAWGPSAVHLRSGVMEREACVHAITLSLSDRPVSSSEYVQSASRHHLMESPQLLSEGSSVKVTTSQMGKLRLQGSDSYLGPTASKWQSWPPTWSCLTPGHTLEPLFLVAPKSGQGSMKVTGVGLWPYLASSLNEETSALDCSKRQIS